MEDEELQIGSPVKDFVKSFLLEAEAGLNDQGFRSCSEADSHVKIELSATEVKEVGGGLKIHVFSLGGKKEDADSQKMTLYAKKIDPVEEAQRKAELKNAEVRLEALNRAHQKMK